MTLNHNDKTAFKSLAINAIQAHLSKRKPSGEIITTAENRPKSQEKHGVFVTIKKNHHLRGCVGSITSNTPLLISIPHTAIQAATNDHRFPPVTIDEFPHISVTISILSPPSPTENYTQINIGSHGIIFEYQHFKSVFLPEVPVEQHWDLITTLKHLEQKAKAPFNSWKSATYHVFESIKW